MEFKEMLQRSEQKRNYRKVQDGEKIDLTKVENVEEVRFNFGDKDVIRYFYRISGEDEEIMMPYSVNKDIVKEAREGATKVVIYKSGEGKNTKYVVKPVEE